MKSFITFDEIGGWLEDHGLSANIEYEGDLWTVRLDHPDYHIRAVSTVLEWAFDSAIDQWERVEQERETK